MSKKYLKLGILTLVVGVVATLSGCGFDSNPSGEKPLGGTIHNTQESFDEGIAVDGTAVINGSGVFVGSIAGTSATLSSSLNYFESYEAATATDTLAIAESGKTFYLSGASTTYYLPTATTSAGAVFRFVVSDSITATTTISTTNGNDDIEGTLIVAGAVVDCDAEDRLEIVANGENLGDFVELRSNGTKWFIGASGILTANKMYCTKT